MGTKETRARTTQIEYFENESVYNLITHFSRLQEFKQKCCFQKTSGFTAPNALFLFFWPI